jgi:hypothetical protein
VWAAWRDTGAPQAIEYAAAGLTLSLGLPADPTEAAPNDKPEPAELTASNRFREALLIVDPGASNPSGIAHAIVSACAEIRAEGGSTTRDPAVRLMVARLAWVCRTDSNIEDFVQLLGECRRRASEEPRA